MRVTNIRSLAVLLLLVICAGAAVAAPQSRVVVIIAGSSSIRDFADPSLPGFPALLKTGSAGLLNVRVGRPCRDVEPGSKSGFEPACLSLGASAMATGGAEIRRAGDASGIIDGLRVADLYKSRTNLNFGSAQVLHAEIARMQRVNLAASYRAKPGEMGSTLRNAGIRTAVIGNSDIPGEVHREAVTAAMDENGVVDYGEVDGDKVNQPDPTAPFGIRSNPKTLLDAFDRLSANCRFVTIDFGDTFRADAYAESCSDRQAKAIRKVADARLGRFVADVANKLDLKKDMLIVVSPNARSFTEIEGERLGAIIIAGPGFGEGMLTSPSTHKPGAVTLADVAPTILGFFGLKPTVDMIGRPIHGVAGSDAAQALVKMNAVASAQSQRQVVMRWASVAQSVILVLVLAAILLTGSMPAKKAAAWATLSVVAIPLAMLILPVVYTGGMIASIVLLVLITAVVMALAGLVFRSASRAFVWLCGITVAALIIDLFRGAPIIGSSIAGYNIVEGARYYGIGNELMGTMLGATITGLGMALAARNVSRKVACLIAVPVFIALFLAIGAPMLGANVGGALATAPAIAAALLVIRGWRPNARGVAVILAFTVVAIAALFAADAIRGGAAQSHAGRAVGMLTGGDASGMFVLMERKVALNCMLVVTSVWSRLLGICLAGAAILSWWTKRIGRYLTPYESAALVGGIVGTIGAFIFNDSGVVAGATCVVFPFALLALKALGKDNAH